MKYFFVPVFYSCGRFNNFAAEAVLRRLRRIRGQYL